MIHFYFAHHLSHLKNNVQMIAAAAAMLVKDARYLGGVLEKRERSDRFFWTGPGWQRRLWINLIR